MALSWEAARRLVAARARPGARRAQGQRSIDSGRPASAILRGATVDARRRDRASPGHRGERGGAARRQRSRAEARSRGDRSALRPPRARRVRLAGAGSPRARSTTAPTTTPRARRVSSSWRAPLQRQPRPRRSLVLVAFSGEEAGLIGSREYVADPRVPLANTVAMVNLDMIGRLRSRHPRRVRNRDLPGLSQARARRRRSLAPRREPDAGHLLAVRSDELRRARRARALLLHRQSRRLPHTG